MVCVPLTAGAERIGALQILDKSSGCYEERDRILLEHFASQAAVAIRNAGLFESLVLHSGLYTKSGTADLMNEMNRPAHSERLSMLFADMRAFTQLCNTLQRPERTLAFLNDFLGMLSDIVLKHNGMVNKFLGDGMLALFRGEDSARRAVKCTFEMVSGFEHRLRSWKRQVSQRLDFLDIGIGIVTDEAMFGRVGSSNVRDVTVFGAPVNLAASLEKAARGKDKRILVDAATFLDVEDLVAHKVGPEPFRLGKPGQAFGIDYDHYTLIRLKPESPIRIFICHNHKDRDFVERELTGPLEKFGIATWYSNHDILPGQDFIRAVEDGLARSDWMVVVVSPNAATDWVKIELKTAFSKDHLKSRIIPLVIDGADVLRLNDQLHPLQRIEYPAERPVAEQVGALLLREQAKRSGSAMQFPVA